MNNSDKQPSVKKVESLAEMQKSLTILTREEQTDVKGGYCYYTYTCNCTTTDKRIRR